MKKWEIEVKLSGYIREQLQKDLIGKIISDPSEKNVRCYRIDAINIDNISLKVAIDMQVLRHNNVYNYNEWVFEKKWLGEIGQLGQFLVIDKKYGFE